MAESTNVVTVDEELWFGTVGDDKELEERAAQSMAAVAARVLGAKPFPAAARRLEELTRDVSTKIEQVVGVLESDPGLSMRLLRLVNSAGYALRVRCTSVRHAASLVGMRRLHQLATTAAVLDLFETDNPAIKNLLGHAAVVGAFCRYLAVHVDLGPDELFTCGFLHDIGKLMLIDAEGEPYLDLVRQAGDSADALHVLEQQHFGFDHAVLGAHVLKNWRIPNPVPRVVAWHHNVARAYQADPTTASMVQTLRLADQLSYLVRTNPNAEGIVLAAQSPAASYLGVSEAQLSSMWADLTRLSQRIHATPGADQGELIPREDSIPPGMRKKKRGKSMTPVRSLPPGTFTQAPGAATDGSMPAPSVFPGSTTATVSEMPKAFVCVVCNRASFGNKCPVCSGHVCAKHQVGPEQWCTDCAAAYRLDVRSNAFPMWERLTALGIVIGAGLLSVVVAVLAGRPVLGALVGSTLLASLCITLVLVGRRFLMKRAFLQKRGHVASDEPSLPLGLSVPPEPVIAVRDEQPLGVRPTVLAGVNDLPALFSMVPASHEAPPPSSVAVAPPPPSVAAPAPPPTDVAPPNTHMFSSPAPAQAMVSSPSDAVPRGASPTVPSRKRPHITERFGDVLPDPNSQPTFAAPQPAHDSVLPDAPGWRPIERTEPASPRSRTPSDIRRLAETLPSLPPNPEVPVIEEPPPSVAEPLPVAARIATAPIPEALPVAEGKAPAAPHADAPASEPARAPAHTEPPDSVPESELPPSAENSGIFVTAACHPVEPSQLVACRPSSLRPVHYACSRAVMS